MTNDQAPMTNKAPMTSDQSEARLSIGCWGLFICWSLGFGHWRFRSVRCLVAAALACTVLAACADKNAPPPETARQRQDRALRDPFAYGPDGEMADPAAGRDAHTFDRDGFKRDMDRFWNP
jgi:hypothetical protein